MALTFGQIRARYEDKVGQKITALALADMIDEAQIEIAKVFGRRVSVWYPRPVAFTTVSLTSTDIEIPLAPAGAIPEGPGELYLGEGVNYEHIQYEVVRQASIAGVVRGAVPVSWPNSTPISIPAAVVNEQDLPVDYLKILEVRNPNGTKVFNSIVTEEMKIYFTAVGMYKLVYIPVPANINHADNNALPEVHSVFHNDIVAYCVAKYWEDNAEGISGEENRAVNLMANFYRRIGLSARELRRNVNQQYTINVDLWG